MIFYTKSSAKSQGSFNPHRFNASEQWAKHRKILLVLREIAKNETDFFRKREAEDEMKIAERKSQYWYRQPHFDLNEANTILKTIQVEV